MYQGGRNGRLKSVMGKEEWKVKKCNGEEAVGG